MIVLRPFLFTVLLWSQSATVVTAQKPQKEFSIAVSRSERLVRRDTFSSPVSRSVVADVLFGGQRIPVNIDTGSTFTLVASNLNGSDSISEELPTLYNPNASSTYYEENDPADALDCTDQAGHCVLGVDSVSLAGLSAKQMTFGLAVHIHSGVFASGQAGVFGFGRQSGDPATWKPRDQTFWYQIGANLPLPYLFAVDIYSDRSGTFDFGYIDKSKYRGDVTYAAMDTNKTQWNFNMTGFAIGNQTMQHAEEFTGIVDTGGPNIGLPAQITNAYFDSIGGAPSPGHSHTYPCSAYPPPDLTLRLASGGTLVLNGTFLVQPPDDSSQETCNGRIDNSVQTGYNIGACMLDQKFVIFDNAGKRLGFADKAMYGSSHMSTSNPTLIPSTTAISSSEVVASTSSTGTAKPSVTTNAAPINAAPIYADTMLPISLHFCILLFTQWFL